MSVRRALALAACGLAGGSVLLSAVVVGKQPARGGGDSEPRPGGSAVPSAAPPGLLLLPPTASCPPTAGWIERPAGSGSYWDSNWDRWARPGCGDGAASSAGGVAAVVRGREDPGGGGSCPEPLSGAPGRAGSGRGRAPRGSGGPGSPREQPPARLDSFAGEIPCGDPLRAESS